MKKKFLIFNYYFYDSFFFKQVPFDEIGFLNNVATLPPPIHLKNSSTWLFGGTSQC